MKFRKVLLGIFLTVCCQYSAVTVAQVDTTFSYFTDTIAIDEKEIPEKHPSRQFAPTKNEVPAETRLTDSILRKKHNPKLAIGLSAMIPGAGQIYNRKWWKLPIIYAGLGASIFCIAYYATKTNMYKFEYRYRMQGEFEKINPSLGTYSDANVLELKKYHQRNMEIAIAATAIIYVLNIIDAAVDAHLFYFDISDDLALRLSPYVKPTPFETYGGGGIAMTFALK